MQYILTEAEYNNIRTEQLEKIKAQEELINSLCQRIAENEPILMSWQDKDDTPEPHGCYHVNPNYNSHCDECPVIEFCKLYKSYSK